MKPSISPNSASLMRAALVETAANFGDEVMLEHVGVPDIKKKKKVEEERRGGRKVKTASVKAANIQRWRHSAVGGTGEDLMNEKTAEDKLVIVSHCFIHLDAGEGPVNKGFSVSGKS